MALSVEVLRALAAPATVDELSRRLEVPEAHLHRELERLERRGYVRRLACGPTERTASPSERTASPTERTASPSVCGWCALKATCDATAAAERWLRA